MWLPSHYQKPIKPPIPLMGRLILIKRQASCMDRNMKNINISESQPSWSLTPFHCHHCYYDNKSIMYTLLIDWCPPLSIDDFRCLTININIMARTITTTMVVWSDLMLSYYMISAAFQTSVIRIWWTRWKMVLHGDKIVRWHVDWDASGIHA